MRGFVTGLLAVAVLFAAHDVQADDSSFKLLRLAGIQVKWGNPVLGTGAVIRYAFITQTTRFAGTRNCQEMTSLDALGKKSGLAGAQMRAEADAAFAMWSAEIDLTFERTDDESTAQILIGAQGKPEGWAFADVSFADAALTPARIDGAPAVKSIERSLICLNPARAWKIGFGGDIDIYDLRYVFTHEIGHAIGLDHPGPHGQLMSFQYGERFRGLQTGDRAGAALLYGKRPQPSDGRVADIAPALIPKP